LFPLGRRKKASADFLASYLRVLSIFQIAPMRRQRGRGERAKLDFHSEFDLSFQRLKATPASRPAAANRRRRRRGVVAIAVADAARADPFG
jgi:hypothetical protein